MLRFREEHMFHSTICPSQSTIGRRKETFPCPLTYTQTVVRSGSSEVGDDLRIPVVDCFAIRFAALLLLLYCCGPFVLSPRLWLEERPTSVAIDILCKIQVARQWRRRATQALRYPRCCRGLVDTSPVGPDSSTWFAFKASVCFCLCAVCNAPARLVTSGHNTHPPSVSDNDTSIGISARSRA